MTKKQRIEHKQGNQRRKEAILKRAKYGPKEDRGYWAKSMICQNGKWSQ